MPNQSTLRTTSEGRTIAVVGDIYRFLATGDQTNGKYAMFEAIVPPGGGPIPHVHSREEERWREATSEDIVRWNSLGRMHGNVVGSLCPIVCELPPLTTLVGGSQAPRHVKIGIRPARIVFGQPP